MMPTDRRGLLQRAFLLAGATFASGLSIEVLAKEAAAAPRLLAAPRFTLLSAVADTIVPRTDTPGAVDVGVPGLFDALLRNWAGPEQRANLIAALDKVGGLGDAKGGFASLTPARQYELLAAHDIASLKRVASSDAPVKSAVGAAPSVADPNYGRLKQGAVQSEPLKGAPGGAPAAVAGAPKKQGVTTNALRAGPAVVDPNYAKLKELIVVLYYYSEPALTKELPYEHSPGRVETLDPGHAGHPLVGRRR